MVKEAGTQTQCDFEDPYICYFVQDQTDDFDWIRTSGSTPTFGTGPENDHTYGTLQGFYVYIETSYPRYNNETARLWTSPYPATNGTCVKWFYHMYGATVNTLNVYIVNTTGTVGAPAWTNRNNQENLWRLGKISVETLSTFQIVFEGIVGRSDTGDIALDDFRIIDGACLRNETCDINCMNGGVCVTLDYGIENCQCMTGFVGPTCNIDQAQCDFEDRNLCYFVQDELDDFDWIRTSGSTPSFRTGPDFDHTYGTLQGFYIYIETSSPRNLNDIARLWTMSYPPTNGTCVQWFYHMYGTTVNTMSVYIVNTADTLGTPVWSIKNEQGNVWRRGQIFVETSSAYQIVFEGIAGKTCDISCLNGGVCFISDYGFENCQCTLGFVGPTCNINQAQCDFEDQYLCYFVQDESDDFDWIRTSGSTPSSRTGPEYDHTYGTLQGFYIYIETSPRNLNDIARLWTVTYPATNGRCVQWFYHMYGATVNTLSVYIVNTADTLGTPVWSIRNEQGNVWRRGQIFVETSSAYQIVFEGIAGSSYTGDIALDDVKITDGACVRNETCDISCLNGGVCFISDYGFENCQCTLGFVGPTCNITTQTQCDFEDPYICYFVQDKTGDFDWIRTSGSTPTSGTGPRYDHTYGTLQGSYMYIETSYPRYNNETARLWTSPYPATNGTCVKWFYHMYGVTVNTLNVYIVNTTGTVGAPAWTNRNNQENLWRLGKISVETMSAFQIVGDIALDDFRIIDGACLRNETCDIDCLNGGVCASDHGIEDCQCMSGFVGPTCNTSQTQCDFEDPYICYFVQDETDDFDWIRTSGSTPTSGTGPEYDHTYGTLQGSYMYIETSYPRYNNETARLWTLPYPATNGTCVKWFYHMYGATVNKLNVYIVDTTGTVGVPAWTNRNNQENLWRLGKIPVETMSAFQIVFEGIVGRSDTGDIALDDVTIIDGACLKNGKIHLLPPMTY
ncbi:MAM and LDL-receptor class A domain-containing protein 1-like [Anneissia japonica]|uniref:MAM and LDL-receptor class A domain-containing protein 1-like n=1 Tax=Anneissia japonica TaxID=1529436 RepID=UPI0014256393|nr:MAM and LDL-receptor class A domain-containing protein 1-like [Anneissia japonica]